MWRAYAGALALAGTLALALIWRGCSSHQANAPDARTVPTVILKPTEKAKIIFNAAKREIRYAVRKPDGTIEHKVEKAVRRAEVIVKETGEVKVSTRRWGFCLEPGLGIVAEQGVRPAGDVQFFYARGFGVNTGLYWNDRLQVFFAGSYALAPIKLANVSIWAGVNLKEDLLIGVRVRLN